MPRKKPFNPFYWLLIPVGALFVITATCYGYMAFQLTNAVRSEANVHSEHPLFTWLRTNGNTALLLELAVLAVLTVGAIALESRHDAKRNKQADDEKL